MGGDMEKQIYLFRTPEHWEPQAFKRQIFEQLLPWLLQSNPQKLKVSLTESRPPRLTVLPLKRCGLAMISVWGGTSSTDHSWHGNMASLGLTVEGYRVSESVPVAYNRDWPDGTPSPGVVMLTLMKKNSSLTQSRFMEEWFGRHTPMAMRIHPLWNYTRNVVEGTVLEGSSHLDGIVEEHFRRLKDVTNPTCFFGGALNTFPNMCRVGLHANKFLEVSAVENYILTEYHIRSTSASFEASLAR
jgi:hypothetical protein